MRSIEHKPAAVTGILRYDWQIECARQAKGVVLNVGCNEDPARLRARFGSRIINCDLEAEDHHMKRPNHADLVFNCLDVPWPVAEKSAALVVLGDILEHFTREAMVDTLAEARRVAAWVCVTVPEDTRIDEAEQHRVWAKDAYNLHTTVVTREVLEQALHMAGWSLTRYTAGLWGIGGDWGPEGIKGHCALARRGRPRVPVNF